MNNLGGKTVGALVLTTLMLATSVVAQEIGPGPSGKKKDQSPSIAAVDESILLGCPDPGVVCCLPSGAAVVRPSAFDCRASNGVVISYTPDVADFIFDYPVSFPNTAVFNQWGGCAPVVCCLPNGLQITITEAECSAVGGSLNFFEDSFDPGCPPAGLFMSEFVTGVCFDPDDGSCIDNTGISKRACDLEGGVFLGFPTYAQVAGQPVWADPVPNTGGLNPFEFQLPARQWLEAQYPNSGLPCDSCVGGGEPDGNSTGTRVFRRGIFGPTGTVANPENYELELPKWSPPAGYQVNRVRIKLEGGLLLKFAGENTDAACGNIDLSHRNLVSLIDSPALNVPLSYKLMERFGSKDEGIDPKENHPGSDPKTGRSTYAGFFDFVSGAGARDLGVDSSDPANRLTPTDRTLIAIGLDRQDAAPADPDGFIVWDSEEAGGTFSLDQAEWVGAGSNSMNFEVQAFTSQDSAPANYTFHTKSIWNVMATVCYDYEQVITEPCECPEDEDLHLREPKASVLALPKVDLRWAYTGPSEPTPADLKDAGNYELEQDTIFQLTNDFPEDVRLQVLVVNGDGPIPAVNAPGGTINDFRSHLGWNQEVFDIILTGNQPQVASFAQGGDWVLGVADADAPVGDPEDVVFESFTILDPLGTGSNPDRAPGRPASGAHPFQPNPHSSNPFAGPYDRELRGFAYIVAVESTGNSPREIRWNHLDGVVNVINYADTAAWTYRPVGLRALNASNGGVLAGSVNGSTGMLKLDDEMYAKPACETVFGFQAQGSGSFGSPEIGVTYATSLELVTMPVVGDFRSSGSAQDPLEGTPLVEMQTRVWNENEVKFEENISFECWRQFSDALVPEIYTSMFLETDMGKARICAANAGANYLDASSDFGLAMPTFPLFTTRAHHLLFTPNSQRPTSSAGVTARHVGRLEARIRYAR